MTAIDKADGVLKPLEDELVELARSFARGIIEEDTYLQAKEKVVLEKTRLKQEKQRLQRSRENNWVEPARKVVNTLQTLGKTDIENNLSEISGIVQKIGTNRLISRKNVFISFSEDYDFVQSLLTSVRVSTSNTSPTGGGNTQQSIGVIE